MAGTRFMCYVGHGVAMPGALPEGFPGERRNSQLSTLLYQVVQGQFGFRPTRHL